MLADERICFLVFLAAHNRFVVIGNIKGFFLTVIMVPLEIIVGIGLLEQ